MKAQLKEAIKAANLAYDAWEAAGRPDKGHPTYADMVAANKLCNQLKMQLYGTLAPAGNS